MLEHMKWSLKGPYTDSHPALAESFGKKDFYWLNSGKNETSVDLFCGAGGMSLGFERAGFRHLLALDIDQDSIETYKYNRPSYLPKLLNASSEELIQILQEKNVINNLKERPKVVIGVS